MKKIILLFMFLAGVYAHSATLRTGSDSRNNALTEIEKLHAIAKVWGFLKYYHPNVANGSQNWDNQLFMILQEVDKIQTQEEFSDAICRWIGSLGEVKRGSLPEISPKNNYFDKNLDFAWFKNRIFFSKELSEKLEAIEANRFQGLNFYVSFQASDPNASPLQFTNEVKYSKFDWSDKKMRLLALFRYWNYVAYFFPYKYQMDENWDKVLVDILPEFVNAKSELEFHLAMRELSIKLNDSHASIGTGKMFEKFGDKFVPADFKIIDRKAVVIGLKNDSLATVSDIRIGDVITKVDGKTIDFLIKENRKYVEGSNEAAILRNIYWAIFNGKSDSLQIEYNRAGEKAVKYIKRYPYQNIRMKAAEKEKWKFLDNNVAYIDMSAIAEGDVPAIMKECLNSKAIIFDLRNNSNGTNYIISEYLNPEPREFVKFIDSDLSAPGRFVWRKEIEKCGKINPDYYKGKVIILVNEVTQSHGEYTAMNFQTAPDATVIGSQTSGADGGVVRFEIINGFWTQFSSYGVFYPNKKETQRIGIVPDIKVKQTILGIQQKRDEFLERALLFAKRGN
ncbi:S41 family peptidase [Flavobacterium sp. IB48]|uniref:S41 family peptidase n=1 Tax=Flavobacterium sp. IB48 TaxID=2779375 RepID=UPI0018E7050D|nr:S41 family peptidase [Flavobacterium sp. IB48]MBJ2125983.1 peptidase S41 [Flavobacterium sp. IB48]